jgi:hypothetical protein
LLFLVIIGLLLPVNSYSQLTLINMFLTSFGRRSCELAKNAEHNILVFIADGATSNTLVEKYEVMSKLDIDMVNPCLFV